MRTITHSNIPTFQHQCAMQDFSLLEKSLGFTFTQKDLLIQAFTHRSYLNENPNFPLLHNERLEFLGDAVLELIITEHLYRNYPEKSEGELTTWRAALVNAKMLSNIAKELDFNTYLLLSKGEAKETGKPRDYILANALEAFIGALYLDGGFKTAEQFVQKHLLKELPRIIEAKLYRDAKSRFQEIAQAELGATPTYAVLKEWGPDHAKQFRVGVFLGNELIAEGEGSSKQEAEENAAQNALTKKYGN